MQYAAFFDLDHTILKINSGAALIRRAHINGLLSTWKLFSAYYLSIMHKAHLIEPLVIVENLGGWLAKEPVIDVEKLCREIVEKDLIPAIRPEMITEISRHREKGAQLVILSSAIASICVPLAKHLGIHTVISTELEVVNQHYTGRAKDGFCFKEEKLIRMNQYLSANNSSLEDSWYYGDSMDDLPVLQAVGHAVCIKPGKRLEKIARERNWEIHKWE